MLRRWSVFQHYRLEPVHDDPRAPIPRDFEPSPFEHYGRELVEAEVEKERDR